MATLLDLHDAGVIRRVEAELPGRAQDERLIYIYPKVAERIENEIAELHSIFEHEIDPIEQLFVFIGEFCSGDPLIYERQIWSLNNLGDGIWELKTRDLRLFGWFPVRDCFVCAAIDQATRVKELNLYGPYAQECVRHRDALDLDEPKFLVGDYPNAVLSNFTYPAP